MSHRLRNIWQETQAAFERGWYEYGGGRVDLSGHLDPMRAGTRLYLPDELHTIPAPKGPIADRRATAFEVTAESTLEAAIRLAPAGPPAVLNFASARNPGGGVANGAQSQEESLARSSALYDSLTRCPQFYAFHRDQRTLLYSDRIIYSPHVPVYRRDDGSWLPEPAIAAFLTAAAPNRRMIERNQPADTPRIAETLTTRARGVLAVAAAQRERVLVLGAWGCGVFGNDPEEAARAFAVHLRGEFADVFDRIVFAILDRDESVRRPFEREFAAG